MQTELTTIAWEPGFQLNLSSWAVLEIAKRRGESPGELSACALNSCIFYLGAYVMTRDLVAHVEKGITWNAQVYEAWSYGRCDEIHRICRGLSPSDADALLHASGYADVSLDELSDASDEAVQEAWAALYGE